MNGQRTRPENVSRALIIVALGGVLGFVFGTLTIQSWNMPVDWVGIGFSFVVLPCLIVRIALRTSSRSIAAIHVFCLTAAYTCAFQFPYLVRHGLLYDDTFLNVPLSLAYFYIVWRLRVSRFRFSLRTLLLLPLVVAGLAALSWAGGIASVIVPACTAPIVVVVLEAYCLLRKGRAR